MDTPPIASHPTLLLLLAGAEPDELAARLDAVAALAPAAVHRRVPNDPFDAVQPHPAPWSAAIEVTGTSDAVVDALRSLLDGLAGLDPARSTVVAGTAQERLPGDGPVRLLYCMRRRPDLSLEAFQRYWATEHAALTVDDPTRHDRSYHQLHAEPAAGAQVAERLGLTGAGYDGVAISDMASLAELPLVAERGDRVNFVDADTEVGLFVERLRAVER